VHVVTGSVWAGVMVGKGLVELELVSVGIENLDAAVVVK
jgi:hypothetical protein